MFQINQTDVARLADAISRDFPTIESSSDRAWSRPPAVRVIDCVLSLNRQYDAFVVPRLNRFEREHSDVQSIRSLRRLIDSYPSPADFFFQALNYRHTNRAEVLSAVVDFMLSILGDTAEESELARLKAWAETASPGGHLSLGIRGFALAGFQYLRMLFGANTTKPDKHIRGYVVDVVGHPVTDVQAIMLLEAASERLTRSLRDLDTTIWERRARAALSAATAEVLSHTPNRFVCGNMPACSK